MSQGLVVKTHCPQEHKAAAPKTMENFFPTQFPATKNLLDSPYRITETVSRVKCWPLSSKLTEERGRGEKRMT